MAECRRDRNRTAFRPFVVVVVVRAIRFGFQTSETARPDEVMPVDGVASQEKTGDVNSTTSTRNVRRG